MPSSFFHLLWEMYSSPIKQVPTNNLHFGHAYNFNMCNKHFAWIAMEKGAIFSAFNTEWLNHISQIILISYGSISFIFVSYTKQSMQSVSAFRRISWVLKKLFCSPQSIQRLKMWKNIYMICLMRLKMDWILPQE